MTGSEDTRGNGSGPLRGVRVIEMAGLGPGPFAAMMLADMGADVLRIDRRPSLVPDDDDYGRSRQQADARRYVMHRGRRSVAVDVKHPAGRQTLLDLVDVADVLIDVYRPGVMERLGLGPEECRSRNERLIYGRMTGWGQDGPLAQRAGHDINYIAVAGALNNFARRGQAPVPPLSVVGDLGGGGMFLAFGILAALVERSVSGKGQVVDAAMVDGVAMLLALVYGQIGQGRWRDEPGTNFADTGSPYYDVYRTADGRYMAVGALEAPFYQQVVAGLGLELADLPPREDSTNWECIRQIFAGRFAARTLAEWRAVFDDTDACVSPVVSLTEAPQHPHLVARGTYVEWHGAVHPAPAPRLDRTPGGLGLPPPIPGEHTGTALADWGLPEGTIADRRASGAIT